MKWEKILIALVSAGFAVILYVLLPIESEKYKLKLVSKEAYPNILTIQHSDLDGDGDTEMVRWKKRKPVPAIVVQQSNFLVVDQWNMKGEWISETKNFTSDYDHDGFREVVSFTYHKDSIWLNVIEPMQAGSKAIFIAIDRVEKYNGNHDWFISAGTPTDMNGDGFEDYVVSMQMEAGNTVNYPTLLDMDGDGWMEITGSMSAPGNIVEKDFPVHDSIAWLLVYDNNLSFKSVPVSYPGRPSYVRVLPLKKGDRQLLVSAHFARMKDEIINLLQVWEWMDDSLQVISSKNLPKKSRIQLLCEDQSSEGNFYLVEGGSIVRRNEQLNETGRRKNVILALWSQYHSEDIDGDGLEERCFYENSRDLIITRNDFSNPVRLDLGFDSGLPHYSVKNVGDERSIIVFRGSHAYKLDYSKNLLYPFRLLILLVSFAAYYFIFSLVASIQKRRMERRLASERTVLHYQLTNVMQQLDPHFLFNALSNISSYYHKGEKEHAQNYLAKISKLIRSSLENSEKMTISLQEELAFVQDYLFVEGIRMGDRFDHSIDVEEKLAEGVQVPKMLIQNFVENAMKHGIRHLTDRKGMIKIYSIGNNGDLQICVEDNGVGRKRAEEIGSFGTGNGLNMVRKTLDIFEKLQKVRITFEIEDLSNKNSLPSGTRVRLIIPV